MPLKYLYFHELQENKLVCRKYFPNLTAGLNLNPISPPKSLHSNPDFYSLISQRYVAGRLSWHSL